MAVIRYSGFWSESNYDEHLASLQAALRAADLKWTGEPVYARDNPPFTPWFMRRNEIWLPLAPTREGHCPDGARLPPQSFCAGHGRSTGSCWPHVVAGGTVITDVSVTEARRQGRRHHGRDQGHAGFHLCGGRGPT